MCVCVIAVIEPVKSNDAFTLCTDLYSVNAAIAFCKFNYSRYVSAYVHTASLCIALRVNRPSVFEDSLKGAFKSVEHTVQLNSGKIFPSFLLTFSQVTQSSLRSHIGVVPQDTVLFNNDIL